MCQFKRKVLLIIILLITVGCSASNYSDKSSSSNQNTTKQSSTEQNSTKHHTKLKSSVYDESCQFLFCKEKQKIKQSMIRACLVDTQAEHYPQLIDSLLSIKPALPKTHLGTILSFVMLKKETVEDSSFVEKLVNAGAPTSNISINNLLIKDTNVCDSIDFVINYNIRQYQDARPHYLWLFTQLDRGYQSCPESIKSLIAYNPKLRDVRNTNNASTPLHNYLLGVNHPTWDLNIAKLLITKNNIKMRDKKGYTPLHYIQMYMANKKDIASALFKEIENKSKKKTDADALQKSLDKLIVKIRPKCSLIILENGDLTEKSVVDCFTSFSNLETPYIVSKLLQRKPPIASSTLSTLVVILANDLSNALHTESIKSLVKAGASTENVSVPMVLYGNSYYCSTLMFILKNNSNLYQDRTTLYSPPKSKIIYTISRNQDLHSLSAVGLERGICYEAIEYLSNTHPHLRDEVTKDFKSTPLHIFLTETHWTGWNLKTAKSLISKNNINLQNTYGNTPLHNLDSGAGSDNISEHEIRIIKTMIEHGADVTIKNKKGISVQEMFAGKNPKLDLLFSKMKQTNGVRLD